MSISEFEGTAAEFLSAGICPMNCRYCYIPKNEKMKIIHAKIIKSIKSNEIFERLFNIYGEKLEYLGFWGTEPTLTLPLITEKIPYIMKKFPNIKEFSYSTNGLSDPSIIIDFIKKVNKEKLEHEVTIENQISIDGPPWITDYNRMEGAVEIILRNLYELIEMLNDINLQENLKFELQFKPTIDVENMKEFMDDIFKVREFQKFFKEISDYVKEKNKNKNLIFEGCGAITLVVPGKYTSNDGKIFAQFLNIWHNFGLSSYTSRLLRIINFMDEMYKKRMFTCSGGDGNFGVSENIHLCHRTFYMDEPEYVESILMGESSIGETENWDVSLYNRGIIDWINEKFIISPDDKDDIIRFLYVLRGHHDFWKFQIGYIRAALTELVLCDQADKRLIEDEGIFELFALFMLGCMDCPMENLLNTGSINTIPISLIRLWGNGAFIEVLKTVENISRRKQ